MLYFITGASGAGKSAVLPLLTAQLSDIDWHDFDSVGVPDEPDTAWRQFTTEHWLSLAASKEPKKVGVCGGAILGEIIASPSYPLVEGVKVCFLDCGDVTRVKRLRAQGRGELANQTILSWSAWQRLHLYDPQWLPQVITSSAAPNMRWERWQTWQVDDPRWQSYLIDTTHQSLAETAAAIIDWIKS